MPEWRTRVGALKAISSLFGRGRGLLLLQRASQQFQLSRFEPARRSDQQAFSTFRQSSFRRGEESALGNLGLVYYETGELHKAHCLSIFVTNVGVIAS